jgi:thiamine-monophosphate kinase
MLGRWKTTAEGIGDDAAVLPLDAAGSLVVSTDLSVENVHFRRAWISPKDIGYRATAAALSDLAAMAAVPLGILVAMTLPESWRDSIDNIADGIGEAAECSSTHIVGGDLSDGRELSLAITVLGKAERPLRRSGARTGDRVYVTGTLGGSLAALFAFIGERQPSPEDRARFTRPIPRIPEALWLAKRGVTSAIDISDGLAGDLSHVAVASGVSISIDLDRIPTVSGMTPSDAAGSGEEYELAVTSRAALDENAFTSEFGIPLTEIGTVEAGPPIVRAFDHGSPVPIPPGYVHFRP